MHRPALLIAVSVLAMGAAPRVCGQTSPPPPPAPAATVGAINATSHTVSTTEKRVAIGEQYTFIVAESTVEWLPDKPESGIGRLVGTCLSSRELDSRRVKREYEAGACEFVDEAGNRLFATWNSLGRQRIGQLNGASGAFSTLQGSFTQQDARVTGVYSSRP